MPNNCCQCICEHVSVSQKNRAYPYTILWTVISVHSCNNMLYLSLLSHYITFLLFLSNFLELRVSSATFIRSHFLPSWCNLQTEQLTQDILPKYYLSSNPGKREEAQLSPLGLKYHLRVLLQPSGQTTTMLSKLQTWLNHSKYVNVILNLFFHCQDKNLSQMPDNQSGLFWSPWFTAFKLHCYNQVALEQRVYVASEILIFSRRYHFYKPFHLIWVHCIIAHSTLPQLFD